MFINSHNPDDRNIVRIFLCVSCMCCKDLLKKPVYALVYTIDTVVRAKKAVVNGKKAVVNGKKAVVNGKKAVVN